ncbi:MAG: sugar phosphate isomerase/epimerase [Candidatus Poribacteria bacterium]|nr:sugar phosphate isomerase/epimerase [Candidatus Poribacteria bacterium]
MNPRKLENLDRLAVHTITTKPWSIEEIIANYHQAGISGISVWREVLEKRNPVRIGEDIQNAGMEVVSLVRGGFFTGQTDAEIQASLDDNRRAIDEAAALNASMVVLVCGAVPGQAIRRSLAQIEAGLETLLPYAEKCGVSLAIEPLHPMYADSRSAICTMKTANEFAEKFDSPHLGVAVDVFHLWWDADIESEIQRCGDNGNLLAFHICDWKIGMADMLNDRGLMGEGVIQIREIRAWMEAAGFDGFHEVEIFSNRWWNADQKQFLKQITAAYLGHS